MAKKFFSRYLDTDGDGTGTKDAASDHSGAAEDFYIEAQDNPLVVARMIVSLQDANGMVAAEYGNLNTALTNGVKVYWDRDGTEIDLTDGVPVKTNSQWASLCYDAQILGWGTGEEVLAVRWTFSKSGIPILLAKGDKLIVRLEDDLSDLTSHYFLVQGYEIY